MDATHRCQVAFPCTSLWRSFRLKYGQYNQFQVSNMQGTTQRFRCRRHDQQVCFKEWGQRFGLRSIQQEHHWEGRSLQKMNLNLGYRAHNPGKVHCFLLKTQLSGGCSQEDEVQTKILPYLCTVVEESTQNTTTTESQTTSTQTKIEKCTTLGSTTPTKIATMVGGTCITNPRESGSFQARGA